MAYFYTFLTIIIFNLLFCFNSSAFTDDRLLYTAIKSALNDKWFEAHEAARKSSDTEFAESALYAIKIYNAPSLIDISEIINFLNKNPWVPLDIFGSKIEKSLSFAHNADSIIKWFNFQPPTTLQGKFLL